MLSYFYVKFGMKCLKIRNHGQENSELGSEKIGIKPWQIWNLALKCNYKGVIMYKRDIEKIVREINETFRVLVLTGPRQVGKSTLLDSLMPENMTKVSLDDETLREFAQNDPKQFLDTYQKPLFIDEIQYAPRLFSYIKMEVDKDKSRGQYWLSGSQKFDLMKGVTESLAGRAGILNLNSFSYNEIVKNENSEVFDIENLKEKEHIDINELFEIIFKGGMPELFDVPKINRESFFDSYIQTYIERDVRAIKDIQNLDMFKKFMKLLALRNGTSLNCSNISKDLGVSDKTIKSWVSILQASGLVYLLQPYSSSEIKKMTKMPRIVFMDSGLACFLADFESARALQIGEHAGSYFEAFVVSEIIKGYSNKGKRIDISYIRNDNSDEIDLVICKNGLIHPIEIKKTSTPKMNMFKNFKYLENSILKLGKGGLICNYDKLIKIDENNSIIPVSSVINS